MDAKRKVSKGLGIFTTEWGGSKVDQNIPTVLIVDKTGRVKFKYMSQNTFDRPSVDYVLKFLEALNRGLF
jgi:peroxiredoxin